VEAIENVMGKKPLLKGSSGFTDARFYINRCHIPTLIFGPGGVDQSHTMDEFVEVDALVNAAHIYALILAEYLTKKDEP
jgi:acetylornithine deacetylase/succinyl-diaminopimelate desuccinylase-like protein